MLLDYVFRISWGSLSWNVLTTVGVLRHQILLGWVARRGQSSAALYRKRVRGAAVMSLFIVARRVCCSAGFQMFSSVGEGPWVSWLASTNLLGPLLGPPRVSLSEPPAAKRISIEPPTAITHWWW